jgi:hypothetical protein
MSRARAILQQAGGVQFQRVKLPNVHVLRISLRINRGSTARRWQAAIASGAAIITATGFAIRSS